MVKVDLKVGPNWPNKSHSYHPGCYIWLSVNLKEPVEGLFANQKLPGAPPSGLPSWLFFHPITVVDYNEDTGTITLLIKDLSGADHGRANKVGFEKVKAKSEQA